MKGTAVCFGAIGAAILLASCGQAPEPPAPPPPGVMVQEVSKETVNTGNVFIGRTLAINDVELRARVSGYLVERTFEEGSTVEQGALLYRIDPSIYESEVEAAKGTVAQAQAEVVRADQDLKRYTELARTQNVSQQDLDLATADDLRAKASLQSAEAALMQAQDNLDDTEISAPFDGRLGATSVSIGDLIDPSTGTLVRIVEVDPIYVTFTVSERIVLNYIAQARQEGRDTGALGIPVGITLPNGVEYEQVGEIDFVDNNVNPRTGAMTVRARFTNPDGILVPGINVVVQSRGERAVGERMVIPQPAVQEDQAGRFVLVVDDNNVVEQRRVVLGDRYAAMWVVEQGLALGEQVIVEGVQKVRPGMTVAPEAAVTAFGPGDTES